MNNTSIIGFLAILIVILFLLFSFFLLSVKTEKKLGNRFLAAFLIITAIDISAFFYYQFIELPPSLEMLRNKLSAFKDPLLFLYILSVIYSNFKLQKKHLLHLLPWLLDILILTPNFFLADLTSQQLFLSNYDTNIEIQILRYIGYFISLFYLLAEVYYITRYRKLLLENFTDKKFFKNYIWLKQLLILLFVGQFITLAKSFARIYFSEEAVSNLRIFTLLFGVFFICWLFLKAVNSPKLFRGIDVNLSTSEELNKDGIKNEKTQQQIELLKQYMEAEKPYLNPSLSLRNLARDLKMASKELSILINQNLNQHFFDFVNEYRIKEAMEILKDPSKYEFTVLEILYQVGFNSKSSFNTAFKKYTGTTPTQFKKKQLRL